MISINQKKSFLFKTKRQTIAETQLTTDQTLMIQRNIFQVEKLS